MNSGEAWGSVLLVALFGALLYFRVRFPNASRRSEMAALVGAGLLLFSICQFL